MHWSTNILHVRFHNRRRQFLPVIPPVNFSSCWISAQLVIPCESLDSVLITAPVSGAYVQVIGPPGANRSPFIVAPLLARHLEHVSDASGLVIIPSETLLISFWKLVNGENLVLIWDPPAGMRLDIFQCCDTSEDQKREQNGHCVERHLVVYHVK
ncbi:uncharacterized protein BDZ83DRAFT_651846 [Colletotrichum acutatum]|uniref:Uncharacterized protein n=1 Tax=Glomerella acutata TaxID=27357 RepID=A0AAD8UJ84_GLOAC|nr:uncharacterized protein BDZ83DRAFT_651846 [Colletotrichum acutatum]KAK1724881.1 hypothetical protein BDZ83DRAFT_651846 [Colletotrichum acutatum]